MSKEVKLVCPVILRVGKEMPEIMVMMEGLLVMGSLVFIATCSVRSNCLLYLEVVSILVLFHPIMHPVVLQ